MELYKLWSHSANLSWHPASTVPTLPPTYVQQPATPNLLGCFLKYALMHRAMRRMALLSLRRTAFAFLSRALALGSVPFLVAAILLAAVRFAASERPLIFARSSATSREVALRRRVPRLLFFLPRS